MNAADLAAYVNAEVDEFLESCAATAATMIETHTRGSTIPESVRHQAFLEVGANLYRRRTHNQDAGLGLGLEGSPGFFRPALDPMTPAWPLLRPYIIGIA